MALIVNPSAAANWSLLRERICDKAMEKCGALGIGETPEPEDRSLCLEALDSVLKNMMWHGYTWAKSLVSTATALAFTSGLTNIALPQDFYQVVRVKYLDLSGNEIGLPLMTADQWTDLIQRSFAAPYPLQGFIDNFNKLWLWPVPNGNVTVNLYYQSVILNSVPNAQVDLDSPWMLALPYGVACEVCDEYDVSAAKVARFEAKWAYQLKLGIQNEAPNPPNQMRVDNYYYGDGNTW